MDEPSEKGTWIAYAVTDINTLPISCEGVGRVLVAAKDAAGELLLWTAQPDHAPHVGWVLNVTMHRQTDPPTTGKGAAE